MFLKLIFEAHTQVNETLVNSVGTSESAHVHSETRKCITQHVGKEKTISVRALLVTSELQTSSIHASVCG